MRTAIKTDTISPSSRRTLMAMVAATVVMTAITAPLAAVTPGAAPFRIRDEDEAIFLRAVRTLTPAQRVALADYLLSVLDGTRDRAVCIRFAKSLGYDDAEAEAFADRVAGERL